MVSRGALCKLWCPCLPRVRKSSDLPHLSPPQRGDLGPIWGCVCVCTCACSVLHAAHRAACQGKMGAGIFPSQRSGYPGGGRDPHTPPLVTQAQRLPRCLQLLSEQSPPPWGALPALAPCAHPGQPPLGPMCSDPGDRRAELPATCARPLPPHDQPPLPSPDPNPGDSSRAGTGLRGAERGAAGSDRWTLSPRLSQSASLSAESSLRPRGRRTPGRWGTRSHEKGAWPGVGREGQGVCPWRAG